MGNSLRFKTLATAVSIALVGGIAAVSMNDAVAAGVATGKNRVAPSPQMYIIGFTEAGLMHYDGHVQGLASTAHSAAGRKVDTRSAASVAYLDYLAGQRAVHVNAINSTLGRSVHVQHSYAITMNGIGVELSQEEARKVAALPGVVSVRLAGEYALDTYRGPEFMGADTIWDGSNVPGGVGTRGEGVVVGVIDTGSFAAHPSFADDAACGFGPSNHKLLSTADCLTSSGGICTGATPEANVDNGHGVHTASTAAGNTLTAATTPAPVIPAPFSSMSGVASCASVRTYKVCATTNCDGAAIQAAIENAITDGVDVLNFSISGGTDPWNDNDRTFLDAVNADIFVAASAGNTRAATPDPTGLVNHLGPWMMTVAASTHDNNVAGSGTLSVTGPGTPPAGTTNISLNPGTGPNLGTPSTGQQINFYAANATGCTASGGFPAGYFTGQIALISRGTCTFEEKVNNAEAAGATLAVIYNNAAGAINMNVGAATLPAYSILQSEGTAISAFITANGATATTADFLPAVKQGDVLAGFSLRGPSALPSVTKPDVTGPGVNIYAAVTNGATEHFYGFNSGTSMSSPHIAGAAALLRAAHPDWTPAEVKSALMLTAFNGGHKEDLTTPWDADDVGNGRVDLTKAARTGIVMDETYANFVAANPASSGDPRTLNVPSMRDMDCNGTCNWTRTVRNAFVVAGPADRVFADGFDGAAAVTPTNWTATGNGAAGLTIDVSPSSFTLDGTNTTQALTITATPTTTLSDVTFGDIVLHETGGLAPDVHMTVAVKGTGGGGGTCTPTQLLQDPSIEQSDTFWTAHDSVFGVPFCDSSCGANPRTGTMFVWFGGTATAGTGDLSQTVVFPSGQDRWVNYWLVDQLADAGGDGEPAASLTLSIDGSVIQTVTPGPLSNAYAARTVQVPAQYLDGNAHTVRFDYAKTGAGLRGAMLDDVTLDCAAQPTQEPLMPFTIGEHVSR